MGAITAALSQIDGSAAEGDRVPDPSAPLELENAGEPILLPDGKRIYPPAGAGGAEPRGVRHRRQDRDHGGPSGPPGDLIPR